MKNKIRRLTLMIFITIFGVVQAFNLKAECPETGSPDIHLMFVYTSKALVAFNGNVEALEAEVGLAVDQINIAWENSGLSARAQAVKVMPITYTELTGQDCLIDALIAVMPENSQARTNFENRYNITQGTYPEVEIVEDLTAEADSVGADGIIFISGTDFQDSGFILGVGNIKVPEDDGFGADSCRVAILADFLSESTYVMAHEFGHASGCSHDRQTNGGGSAGYYDFSTGYVIPETENPPYGPYLPNSIGTIMSYADQGEGGRIVPYFSDPEHFYNDDPNGHHMGNPIDDNVRTLEDTLLMVQAHREDTYTLKPASVAFSETAGAARGTVSVNFTPINDLPADGEIVISFPGGFRFNYEGVTTADSVTGFDSGWNLTIDGQSVRLNRDGEGEDTVGGTPISFDLHSIGNPGVQEITYTGNFCFHTFDGEGVEIGYNHAIVGEYITAGMYPLPTFPPPPSYRKSKSTFDRLGCVVMDAKYTLLSVFVFALALLSVGRKLRKN